MRRLVGVSAVLLVVGVLPAGTVQATPESHPTVVLISIDTTRADALSCYGQPVDIQRPLPPVTPVIDELAANGARFESFYAHAPTTLNSHASMLAGTDPHQHGIPRNGFPMDPALPTLAERLSDAGWDAIAVVGAAALEAPMGLDRGFRLYDDTMSRKHGPMYQDIAQGVVRRTVAALARRDATRPLFLFVHFYDPHSPYDAPAPWRDRFVHPDHAARFRGKGFRRAAVLPRLQYGYAEPAEIDYPASLYLGEVAYVDDQIGVLLDRLRAEGLLDDALVVVTADHGEVLSEEPAFAWSHGTSVSEGAMRVPLVVRGTGSVTVPHRVVHRQAEMSGLAATIEALVGLAPKLGNGFSELLRPGPVWDEDGWPERPTRPVFLEATRPFRHEPEEGWNNRLLARGVRAGGFVLTGAPVFDEPFTLQGASDPGLAATLRRMVDSWDARAPAHREQHLADETRAALQELGYLDEDGEDAEP